MDTITPPLRLAALGVLALMLSIIDGGGCGLAFAAPVFERPSMQTAKLAGRSNWRHVAPVVMGSPILVAHLNERSLPPQGGLPSGTTPPSASRRAGTAASPGATPGPDENWERLPDDSEPQRPDAAGGTDGDDAAGIATGSSPRLGPSSSRPNALATQVVPAAGATPDAGAASNQTPAPQGSPEVPSDMSNQGPPPALDVSAINFGPELADQSLESEIRSADTPALAASLRFTEEGRKQLANSHIDEALRSFARAVSIDPGNPYEYFYMGRAWMAKKNYEQALTFLKRAEIEFGANHQWMGEVVGFEGVCYEELGKLEAALSAYRRALHASPNNLMARVGFGRLGGTMEPDTTLDGPPGTDLALPPPPGSEIGPPPTETSPQSAPPADPAAPEDRDLP